MSLKGSILAQLEAEANQKREEQRKSAARYHAVRFYFSRALTLGTILSSLFISAFITDYQHAADGVYNSAALIYNLFHYLGNAAAIAFIFCAAVGFFHSMIPMEMCDEGWSKERFKRNALRMFFIGLMIVLAVSAYIVLSASGL